jgi:hypothetical protein
VGFFFAKWKTMKCGKFRLVIEGPAQYMRERGNALLDRLVSGRDTMFNLSAHLSPSVEMAVLVRLQTDFAGWLGEQRLFARSQGAPSRRTGVAQPLPKTCRESAGSLATQGQP